MCVCGGCRSIPPQLSSESLYLCGAISPCTGRKTRGERVVLLSFLSERERGKHLGPLQKFLGSGLQAATAKSKSPHYKHRELMKNERKQSNTNGPGGRIARRPALVRCSSYVFLYTKMINMFTQRRVEIIISYFNLCWFLYHNRLGGAFF